MKCLILCMGCNDPYYLQEWEDTKLTWAKDILDGKYPDIDIIMYTSSETDEYAYDNENHVLYVAAKDSLAGTLEKTIKAFQALDMFDIHYDCILRTNCSTIINVKLLDAFIHSDLYDKNKIYTSDIRIGGWKAAPYEDSLTYRGNLLLFDKHYANLINYTSVEMVKQITDYTRPIHKDMFVADDITICAIFNTYLNVIKKVDQYEVYQPLPTQYLNEIYNGNENLYGNNFALFVKMIGEYRNVKEYYDANKLILGDFYSNYYNLLSNNLDNLRSDLDVLKEVKIYIPSDGNYDVKIYSFEELQKQNKRD